MAETSVIKEFLVALGFRTDETALKNFESGIKKASFAVVGLATAIETTAVAVAAGVAKFASNLETLYFASIRTGSAATNLMAFDRAAQDFGATAGEARASIEGLAHALRVNPGNEGLLAGLGVQTRDAKGNLRDTVSMMLELSKTFQRQPMFIAEQYASMLGISENTMLAMRNGAFNADYLKKQKEYGPAWQDAVVHAHKFEEAMRDLDTVLQAFGLQVWDALQNKFHLSLEDITKWMQTKGPLLAKRIADIAGAVVDFGIKVAHWIGIIIDKLVEWDSKTNGWSTKLLGALIILKLFGGTEIIGGILSLTAAFVRLGAGITAASVAAGAGGAGGLIGKLGLLLGKGTLVGAAGLGAYFGGKALFEHFVSKEFRDALGEVLLEGGTGFNIPGAKETLASTNPLDYLMMRGRWTHEQAAGILANFRAESKLNPHAVGDNGRAYGIGQWHADRQADFARWAGHDIRDSTLAEQLDFFDSEVWGGKEQAAGALMRAQRNAAQTARVMSLSYERPAGGQATADQRAAAAVTIAQETTINMHGVNDPQAAGKAASDQQGRVNAALTRNVAGAVR